MGSIRRNERLSRSRLLVALVAAVSLAIVLLLQPAYGPAPESREDIEQRVTLQEAAAP